MSLDNRYLEVAESINKKIKSMIKTMTKSVEPMVKTLDALVNRLLINSSIWIFLGLMRLEKN